MLGIFENRVDDVSLIEAIGHAYPAPNHLADLVVWQSDSHLGWIELLHPFSLLLFFRVLVDLAFLFDLHCSQFLQHCLDLVSERAVLILDVLNQSFDVEYWKSIIFAQSASPQMYISANLLLPATGVP